MNFENNQNAHFIMKDYFSVGQPQTFTLLLNSQRLSTVENVLWKYFYHSAFSWCTLCGVYSKVRSISITRTHVLQHTPFLAVRCVQTFWKTLGTGSHGNAIQRKWPFFLENTVVCWTNVTSILKPEMSTSTDSIKYPWFLLLWNKENIF